MMNKAINRTDDKEAVILTEFVMRTVALVTGQSCALKVSEFFHDFGFNISIESSDNWMLL